MQRCAFNIILCQENESYSNALGILNSQSLEERRVELCEKIARKSSKHQKYQTQFVQSIKEERVNKTRQKNETKYKQVKFQSGRSKNSPLANLTEH